MSAIRLMGQSIIFGQEKCRSERNGVFLSVSAERRFFIYAHRTVFYLYSEGVFHVLCNPKKCFAGRGENKGER
jgi:hypothetical protein